MSKYTKGPWAVVDGHYPTFKEVVGPSFKLDVVMIATDLTEDDYQKRTADLQLISAAPNLLEALQLATGVIEDEYGFDDSLAVDCRAAIAKALGETP